MVIINFILKYLRVRVTFGIRVLINVQCGEFVDGLKKFFYFKIIFEYLPMLDVVRDGWPISYLDLIFDLRRQRDLEHTS
jgi:hypothetical protein